MKAADLDPVTLFCRARSLPEPVREYRFAKGRRFAFDWAWPDRMLALECEGGFYGRGKPCPVCKRRAVGAHSSIERLKSDMEKYNLAALDGWIVLRARPEQIESGEALTLVERVLTA